MELKDTVRLMESDNYRSRFKAEYFQLKARLDRLAAMLAKWDRGTLGFIPATPRALYDWQAAAMRKYLKVLEIRARIENVGLEETVPTRKD